MSYILMRKVCLNTLLVVTWNMVYWTPEVNIMTWCEQFIWYDGFYTILKSIVFILLLNIWVLFWSLRVFPGATAFLLRKTRTHVACLAGMYQKPLTDLSLIFIWRTATATLLLRGLKYTPIQLCEKYLSFGQELSSKPHNLLILIVTKHWREVDQASSEY